MSSTSRPTRSARSRDFFHDYRPQQRSGGEAEPEEKAARAKKAAKAAKPAKGKVQERKRRQGSQEGGEGPSAEAAGDEGELIKGAAACGFQHGGQPRRPHCDQLPADPRPAAGGQPQGHQRLPRPYHRGQGLVHPPHRLAVVWAIAGAVPAMNSTYTSGDDDKPR